MTTWSTRSAWSKSTLKKATSWRVMTAPRRRHLLPYLFARARQHAPTTRPARSVVSTSSASRPAMEAPAKTWVGKVPAIQEGMTSATRNLALTRKEVAFGWPPVACVRPFRKQMQILRSHSLFVMVFPNIAVMGILAA